MAASAPAEARITRAVSLDGDFRGADMVMIGTVRTVTVVKHAVPGPFSSTVDVQELGVYVEVPLRHSRRGQMVRVRHPRVLPSTRPVINGFGPSQLRRGATYLFFLRRSGRTFALRVVEDYSLIEFSRPWLRKQARRLRRLPAQARLLELLRAQLHHCKPACAGTIWLTSRSRAFAARFTSKKLSKTRYLADLVALARNSPDSNTRLAAFTVLGRHDVRAVVPLVVRIASTQPRPNVITWLQGFKKPVQIRALQAIVASASDKLVLRMARQRLRYLKKHP